MRVIFSCYDSEKTYVGQKQFDCGHQIINKFVHGSLKGQIRKKISVAYVLTDADDQDRFVGFFTIGQHSISGNLLSNAERGRMPTTVPCAKIGMLGVDLKYANKGYGPQLMKEAFRITSASAAAIGCYGMYLDADAGALDFYKKLQFVFLDGDKSPADSPMFLELSAFQ